MGLSGGVTRAARWGMMIALVAGHARAADGAAIARDGTAGGAPACAACHGAAGEGNAEAGFPHLGGLAAGYLAHELDGFADGSRRNEVMGPIAQSLTPEERAALAAYYAGLPAPREMPAQAPDAADLARGRTLAEVGAWDRGLPACGQCHGPAGEGVGAAFPALAGQPASYLAAQLAAWKDGTRRNDPLGLMAGLSGKLSEADVTAVGAYYASLPAAHTGGAR